MLKRILLVFMIFGMLIACVGLQSTNSSFDTPSYTPLPPEMVFGSQTAYAPTWAAWNITQTAHIASFPTLNTEQGLVIGQTQDARLEQAIARVTYEAQWRATSIQIVTARAEATAQGTNPDDLMATSILETATANTVLATVNADANATEFYVQMLTITAIIEDATANAHSSPTPCPQFAWTRIVFRYRDGLVNPEIQEFTQSFCSSDGSILFSHRIEIDEYPGIDFDALPAFLEDAVSHLSDYPPIRPEVSETIIIEVIGQLYAGCGIFAYSDAIAAYAEGLRGEDLAQALGFTC